MVSNEIEEIIGTHLPGQSSNGYLVCENCNGYYQLQDGESPADFDFCECRGRLSFYNDFNQLNQVNYSNDSQESTLGYDDLQNIIVNLKNKAERRKELFEELSKKVEVQDELLNDIKEGNWSLWETVDQKGMHANVKEQKKLIHNLLDEENNDILNEKEIIDTVMAEETKFINYIHDKRAKLRKDKHWNDTSSRGSNFAREWDNDYAGVKISYVRAVALFIILLILIGFLYMFLVWILK